MTPWFVEQMAMYSSYHRESRNKVSHLFGVPIVAFSILIPMALPGFGVMVSGYEISPATLFGLGVMIYWLTMDLSLGLLTAALFTPLVIGSGFVAAGGAGYAWTIFGITFVGGWIIQLVGHAFEGRKPALTDSLIQILIAPMFIVAEVLMLFGGRKDIEAAVEARWRDYARPEDLERATRAKA